MRWWVMASVAVGYRYVWDNTRTDKEIRADIRDLDVGDLDDMTEDVTPHFKEKLDQRNAPPLDIAKIQASSDPGAMAMGMQSKMQMTFAALNHDMMAKEFPDGKAADKIASRWKGMMQNGGVSANAYPVGPNRILFTVSGYGVFPELKKFVLDQPEIDYFEVNQQKYYPAGRKEPLLTNEERQKKEKEQGIAEEYPGGEPKKKAKKTKTKKKKTELARARMTLARQKKTCTGVLLRSADVDP